jgi:hypothetical protein
MFSETYYLTGYALESSTKLNLGFHVLNSSLVEAAVNNPYDKIGWGNRSAKNISGLFNKHGMKLHKELSKEKVMLKLQRFFQRNLVKVHRKQFVLLGLNPEGL